MNQEFKRKWVTALRSGDYQQTTKALRRVTPDGASHCCLGVAAELAGWQFNDHGQLKDFWNTIPRDLCAEIGLPTGEKDAFCQQDLVMLNDGGASFDQIADAIEANL